jgi:hypothetical protein
VCGGVIDGLFGATDNIQNWKGIREEAREVNSSNKS